MSVGRTLVVIGAVALLFAVPYGGYALYPALLAATLVHELAHAMAVVLSGGTVDGIAVAVDGSGLTRHVGGAPGPVALAGPLAPAAVGAVLIALANRPALARWTLTVLAASLVIATATWVRAGAAIATVSALTVAVAAVSTWRWPATTAPLASVLGAALAFAWLAGREALFTATPTSDTTQLATAFGGAPTTWATAVGLSSLVAVAVALVAGGAGRPGIWVTYRGTDASA